MPTLTFKNPLTITDGTGFTSSFSGEEQLGLSTTINELSIGQNVATSSNVTFNSTTMDETQTFIIPNNAGTQNMVLGYGFISGSTVLFDGNLVVSENHTHEDDMSVIGSVSYGNSVFSGSSVTTIHTSGSTTFGDSLDDVHNITGSYSISGSININGVEINEISNNKPYRECEINFQEYIEDTKENYNEINFSDLELIFKNLKSFFKKKGYLINWKELEKQNLDQTINTLAMASPFSLEEKQILLETTSIKKRKIELEKILNTYVVDNFNNTTIQ